MDIIGICNKLYLGDMNIGIYLVIFLEEIILELFFNFFFLFWGKNENIIEVRFNEMNILFVNNVVNEFNNV